MKAATCNLHLDLGMNLLLGGGGEVFPLGMLRIIAL